MRGEFGRRKLAVHALGAGDRDGRIVGAILIGRQNDGPPVTNAIKDGRDVSGLVGELERGDWEALGGAGQPVVAGS